MRRIIRLLALIVFSCMVCLQVQAQVGADRRPPSNDAPTGAPTVTRRRPHSFGERPSNPSIRNHANSVKRPRPSPQTTRLAQVEDAIEQGNSDRDNNLLVDAESQYRNALSLVPEEWRAYYGLGNLYHDQNKYEDAVQAYNRAIGLNPGSVEARYWLGISLRGLKKYEDAIEQFKQVIHMDPENTRAFYNLGNSYYDLRRYVNAIEAYRRAIDLEVDLDLAGALYKLGNAYLKVGDKEAARAQYEELKPLNAALAQSLLNDINR